MINSICHEKAHHIEYTYQDTALSRLWVKIAIVIGDAAYEISKIEP